MQRLCHENMFGVFENEQGAGVAGVDQEPEWRRGVCGLVGDRRGKREPSRGFGAGERQHPGYVLKDSGCCRTMAAEGEQLEGPCSDPAGDGGDSNCGCGHEAGEKQAIVDIL